MRDLHAAGPVARVLEPFAPAPFEDAYVLRLFGGVHRMVLGGNAPALAAHFPSTGGDGDASAAMHALRALVHPEPPPDVLDALTRPPQTNEVGRAAALASGLLVIAEQVGHPLRLREIGASGGLNLRPDRFWYEQDGAAWGNPASPVRFVDLWRGGAPPFTPGAAIADRRGCDRHPIDATTDDGALTLLSYVWPEPPERFARLRDAVALAHEIPVPIDRADAAVWLLDQLAEPEAGTALVVYHSVVWQYLDDGTRVALDAALTEAGRAATADTPVAWLRLEPHATSYVPAELRLTVWDGSSPAPLDRLLATTGFHGGLIRWNPGVHDPAERAV